MSILITCSSRLRARSSLCRVHGPQLRQPLRASTARPQLLQVAVLKAFKSLFQINFSIFFSLFSSLKS